MTLDEEKAALCQLVASRLPGATVDELWIEESCGCYSEWTQEPPRYCVTFKAPWKRDEDALAKLVTKLEKAVRKFAHANHAFSGGSCCQGDDYVDGDVAEPTLFVRVIPVKPE